MHRLTQGQLFLRAFIGRPHAAHKVLCTGDIVVTRAALTGISKFVFAVERPALDRDSKGSGLCKYGQTGQYQSTDDSRHSLSSSYFPMHTQSP